MELHMNHHRTAILYTTAALALTACGPSQEQISKKLIKGCEAAITHILDHTNSDYEYKSTAKTSFDSNNDDASITLTITGNTLYREFSEEETPYICLFEENKTPFSYRAALNYVDVEGVKYGRVENSLTNLSIGEFSTLDEAVTQAMR
jgi:hypothetical protein